MTTQTKNDLLLQLRNISVHYGGVRALDGVDIKLDEGEIVVLMGPNGAGKSTVLKAIFGLAPTCSGQILWHEESIRPIPHKMVSLGISYVPQGRRVFSGLTIEENLELGGLLVGDKAELNRRKEEIMKIFPVLKHKKKANGSQLSGGEQQMLAIGRGLMADPKILLLDEPSLGLSPLMVKEVFAKIKEINERHRTAIMVVEHNIKSILKIANRAYILDKGKVIYEEKTIDIHNEMLEKVFLGKI